LLLVELLNDETASDDGSTNRALVASGVRLSLELLLTPGWTIFAVDRRPEELVLPAKCHPLLQATFRCSRSLFGIHCGE